MASNVCGTRVDGGTVYQTYRDTTIIIGGLAPSAAAAGNVGGAAAATVTNHVTQISNSAPPRVTDTSGSALRGEKVEVRPRSLSLRVKLREKLTGRYTKSFIAKVNAYTLENIKGDVIEKFQDLQAPQQEFYPRMKTGFQLFRGDYVPQDGFSAHCQPKKGQYISFTECLEEVQKPRDRPSMIIGQPGSGKTVFMKRLTKALLNAEGLHEQQDVQEVQRCFNMYRKQSENRGYDAILHMNIRDIANCGYATLSEVIFNSQTIDMKAEEAQYGLKEIIKNRLRIIMVFDGLDQASWEPQYDRKVGYWEKATTATIFGNILAGHLLSNVPIVMSSREHSVAKLSPEMRPDFISALVGFSEKDAESLYCAVMGDGAKEEWVIMRNTNPAMHSMCLTPLFIIFYMIVKKKYPHDPPNCASAVMVSIIQIFLESDNAVTIHNDDIASLFDKLKKLAFEGTREQRVVFNQDDLLKFKLKFEHISDIIIKVPGFSFLGQRIFDGLYRFFFSHQTLQEILAALSSAEMDYHKFQKHVDDNFQKTYWSVVRSFTCGLLNNERVRRRISETMFKLSDSDLEKKRHYLLKHLQNQLGADQTPAQKLETYVALKEANAFEILRGVTQDIDFSNSPATPAMINTLCTVMKYLDEVPNLSLVNSGMNDELLEILAERANGLEIKIGKLDIRSNIDCKNVQIWGRIFECFSISQCFVDVHRNEQIVTSKTENIV